MCVSVCVCNSLKVYTFMKETLFMYLYAEIEKNNKSFRVKIYNAIKFNFYLGLLRIHKEFTIFSVRSMLCLENLVHCLFIKKCLIEVLVKMGFICGVF